MRIKKWIWLDKQGNKWVANQPTSWADKMLKAGYKVFRFKPKGGLK